LPKAILFDLDGTLWDRNAAVRDLLANQHADLREHLSIPQHEYIDRIMVLESNGSADKLSVYQALGLEYGFPETLTNRLHADFCRRYIVCVRPFPEVVFTLNEQRSRGAKLGIVTNGTVRIQEPKIDGLGLRELMDVIVISEREGVRKPDAAIFNRALDALGISAADAWFVGDNPEADVAGAHAAGLRAFWRRCADWSPPTVPCEAILSLDELLPLVSQASHQSH
jgi:putative hydrolase of the HAD superfamily